LKILESGKNELVLSLEGVDLSVANLVAAKLLENKDVEFAASDYNHPLGGVPVLRVQGSDLKKNVLKAFNEAKEEIKAAEKTFKKTG
jgi:DNA-directed RNA polymerase subunit L